MMSGCGLTHTSGDRAHSVRANVVNSFFVAMATTRMSELVKNASKPVPAVE